MRADDFYEPLRIGFGDAYLLEGLVSDVHPNGLAPQLHIVEIDERGLERELEVEALLLNPRDWFEIQVYTNGSVDSHSVGGRVAGVREFRDRVAYRERRGRWLNVLGPVVFIAVVFWLWWLIFVSGGDLGFSDVVPYALGGAVGVAVGTYNARRP